MRYASICSGVGSCRLASATLDWECAFFAEIDPFASAVLAHHYPGTPNYGDFTQIENDHGPIDLLVGGTPCQSFSVAGKRAGLDSPNGNLAIEFARLAQRLGARWIVWENVPGVFSSRSDDGSSDFDTFLGVLEDVGYSTSWTVLDAQHFGVPQRRRRVFVVGYLGDWRPPAAVLFDSESLSGHSAPLRETREETPRGATERPGIRGGEVIASLDLANLGSGGNTGHRDPSEATICLDTGGNIGVAGTLGGGAGERGWSPDTDRMTFVPTTANSLNARDGKGADPGRSVSNDVAHALTGEGADASEDGTGRGTPLVTHALDVPLTPYTPELADPICANEARTSSHAGNNPRARNVVAYQCQGTNVGEAGTLRGGNGNTSGGVPFLPVAFSSKDDGGDASEVSSTLRAMEFDGSHANGGGQVAVAFAQNQRGELRTSDVMTSLGQGGGKPGEGYPAVAFQEAQTGVREYANAGTLRANGPGHDPVGTRIREGMQVRRLTPLECEKLQGYPPGHTLVPYRGKPAADGPRYRAIGNGWAVPVVRWIFERLDTVERATASSRPID